MIVTQQCELDLAADRGRMHPSGLAALDLFAGIGGLSIGFSQAGFAVTGVDREALASSVYGAAGIGTPVTCDLGAGMHLVDVPVVIGGPPCRPWSAVNLQRRRSAHDDHALLTRFIDHIVEIRPQIFVMENVPALGSDDLYRSGMRRLERHRGCRYTIGAQILRYDRFGAPTRRRRLFTIGVKRSVTGASQLFDLLHRQEGSRRTVGDAIRWLRDTPRGAVVDHDWSILRSIHKYRERYTSGQYGWARLRYDEPAPSFGSVAKTYILHPEAGADGYPERVISVREVLSIMGFGLDVRFPTGTARAIRYQMAANAVSPAVSRAVAQAARSLLTGEPLQPWNEEAFKSLEGSRMSGRCPARSQRFDEERADGNA